LLSTITEFWRDPEGRGVVLGGALDGPQVAAIVMVLAGALVLRERKGVDFQLGVLSTSPWRKRRSRAPHPGECPLKRAPSTVPAEAAGQRLDQFLAAQLEGVSRSRVQLLMDQGDVLVNGERKRLHSNCAAASDCHVTGEPHPTPLKATAEDIPLDVVFEDADWRW
jgi:hypothetical protein